jgi:choline transporter-like protein 2/4/5
MAMLYSAGNIKEDRDVSAGMSFTLSDTIFSTLQTEYSAVPSLADVTSQVAAYDDTYTKVDGSLPCAYDEDCRYVIQWDTDLQKAALYHIFGFFWTTEFILGVGLMTLAMVFVMHYFSRGDRSKLPSSPVLTSLKTVFRYHLGSVALGSFIVAVVQFIRFLIDQLDKQLKKKGAQNSATSFMFKCVKCYLWVLEKILKFINKNAYIVIAITGRGFCWSAIHAASLILKNILRFAAVNVIGGFLLWLGKLAVMVACGFVAFGLSDIDYYSDPVNHPDTHLTSPVLPILCSCVVAYVVASIFMMVFDVGVDTTLLCFCEDCENNNGNPEYAPELLLEAIGKNRKISSGKGGDAMATVA